MKRPDYIEITIPTRAKGTKQTAVKRYFKNLEDKVLDLNFGRSRVRRVFKYKVLSSGFESRSSWYPRKKTTHSFKIRMELQPEKEN